MTVTMAPPTLFLDTKPKNYFFLQNYENWKRWAIFFASIFTRFDNIKFFKGLCKNNCVCNQTLFVRSLKNKKIFNVISGIMVNHLTNDFGELQNLINLHMMVYMWKLKKNSCW